ncbi:MAG: hypothetical protein H7245_08260 [Candidatus Saccharibacteria bacterium]|nr:hypothetical protein [Pseudorhodobacter sp.]
MTLLGTVILLTLSLAVTLFFEWGHAATIGNDPTEQTLLWAFFHSVMMRTAGFNAVDVMQRQRETVMMSMVLMVIGGGNAGTAGAIKVSTMMILVLVM